MIQLTGAICIQWLPAKQDRIIIIINVELSDLNQSILLKVCNTSLYKCIFNITAGVFIFTLCSAQQGSYYLKVILFAFYMHSKNSVHRVDMKQFQLYLYFELLFWG